MFQRDSADWCNYERVGGQTANRSSLNRIVAGGTGRADPASEHSDASSLDGGALREAVQKQKGLCKSVQPISPSIPPPAMPEPPGIKRRVYGSCPGHQQRMVAQVQL